MAGWQREHRSRRRQIARTERRRFQPDRVPDHPCIKRSASARGRQALGQCCPRLAVEVS